MISARVIPAKAGIHKIIPYFLALSLFFFFPVFAPLVLATSKTDYEYQYGQYRQNYAEFSLLKSDYLNTPSLDNQQKAILAAKQTIQARDLAKASFALLLTDLISGTQTSYSPIQPIVASLATTREFYLRSAQKSQSIGTEADLSSYSRSYLDSVIHHDRVVKFGILASKISTLVRIQLDLKVALEDLITKLPVSLPATLVNRIQELRDSSRIIDIKIDTLAQKINFQEEEESADAEIFFSSRVEKLTEIRALQADWINRLIDIDKNYAQTNR